MNVREACDLIEMLAGRGGSVNDVINRALLLKLINLRLKELYANNSLGGASWSGTAVDSTYEYDLDEGLVPFSVVYDSEVIERISYSKARDLRYTG